MKTVLCLSLISISIVGCASSGVRRQGQILVPPPVFVNTNAPVPKAVASDNQKQYVGTPYPTFWANQPGTKSPERYAPPAPEPANTVDYQAYDPVAQERQNTAILRERAQQSSYIRQIGRNLYDGYRYSGYDYRGHRGVYGYGTWAENPFYNGNIPYDPVSGRYLFSEYFTYGPGVRYSVRTGGGLTVGLTARTGYQYRGRYR